MTDTAVMDYDTASSDHGGTPVGHTPARYRALRAVRDDLVRYDVSQAQWRQRTERDWEALQGAQRRTLRDLLDLRLIEHYGEHTHSRRVVLTRRGEAALLLWEPARERT